MKNVHLYLFAEVGRSKTSSLTSENLLIDLQKNLNISNGCKKWNLFLYSIYDISNFNKWLINKHFGKKRDETINFLSSTSIMLLRDFIYVFNIIFICLSKNPDHIYIYNLNKLQLFLLVKFKYFLKNKISLIQADGFVIEKEKLCLFKNVYVFSICLYDLYKKYNLKQNIIHCLPLIFSNNHSAKIKRSINNQKEITILHCGSISEYNLPKRNLDKLAKIVEDYSNVKIIFTTTQNYIPNFFQLYLRKFSKSFILKKGLNINDLKEIIEKSCFGLDLRDEKNLNSNIDFPSKILFYMENNLTIFSTLSKSIPIKIKKHLINFKHIEYYISDIKEDLINPNYDEINRLLSEKCLNNKLRNSI